MKERHANPVHTMRALNVRIPAELRRRARQQALAEDRSLQQIIPELIERWLAEVQKKERAA
jgi:predicted HicB family RNase H-like nuclease